MRVGLGSALLAHALADARQRGLSRFAAWATPFSLPAFHRAGFALAQTVREPFQGVIFERYRVVSG
jgi:N-acetylglutamate synthase-like GNAT family acetyltransferase